MGLERFMCNSKLRLLFKLIEEKVEEFQHSEFHSFREFIDERYRPKKGVLQFCGVYVIYEGDKPIYVGSAGKGRHTLRYRIGDLFSDYQSKTGERGYYHTLTRKLLKRKNFNRLEDVRNFYITKCRLRIVKTDTIRQARVIEAALIEILNPCLND
jgi:hypothetical protein